MSFKASEAQKSSIDALQKFYSIIIAGAFGSAVLKFIESFNIDTFSSDQIIKIILLFTFVITIIPFYHGMERHLYETHIAGNQIDRPTGGKPSPVLFDVFTFMIEGGLLFALGRSLDSPDTFLTIWSLLIAVDIAWSLIVYKIQRSEKPIWAKNNVVWVVIAWIAFFISPYFLEWREYDSKFQPLVTAGLVGLAEILRSIFDYVMHWKFYFPDAERDEHGNITYLAAPYSKGDADVRLARFHAITNVGAKLIENKEIVFSPITMTHPIDLVLAEEDETLGSEYWVAFDESFMLACARIKVLRLPGWEESSGVNREIEFFKQRGVEPEYIDPQDYGIDPKNPLYAAAFSKVAGNAAR